MEDSITSDLDELITGTSDIGSRGTRSRTSFPKRVAREDDDSNTRSFEATEEEDSDPEFEDEDPDEEYTPGGTKSRKSGRLLDKVRESIPLELRRDQMTVSNPPLLALDVIC